MTWFFNRELFMSALGDIKLSKPISLKKMAYSIVFLIVWVVPILFISGLRFDLPFLVFLLAPPLVMGHFASKPVWGGKNLINWSKSLYNFLILEPQGWADLKPMDNPDNQVFFTEHEIWISRRRELNKLFREKKRRREMEKMTK